MLKWNRQGNHQEHYAIGRSVLIAFVVLTAEDGGVKFHAEEEPVNIE